MTTINPEFMKKLSNVSVADIKRFYKNHQYADESLKECDVEGVNYHINAEKNLAYSGENLRKDVDNGLITSNEMEAIIDRMLDFDRIKRKEFLESLQKCGCNFK